MPGALGAGMPTTLNDAITQTFSNVSDRLGALGAQFPGNPAIPQAQAQLTAAEDQVRVGLSQIPQNVPGSTWGGGSLPTVHTGLLDLGWGNGIWHRDRATDYMPIEAGSPPAQKGPTGDKGGNPDGTPTTNPGNTPHAQGHPHTPSGNGTGSTTTGSGTAGGGTTSVPGGTVGGQVAPGGPEIPAGTTPGTGLNVVHLLVLGALVLALIYAIGHRKGLMKFAKGAA